MRDMGTYFEPPRRNATKMWTLMQIIAESGITFHSEGSKAFVQAVIFQNGRPNINRVKDRIKWYREVWCGSRGQRLLVKINKNTSLS